MARMGVWTAGLYSGDFALDLRSAIRAVGARLKNAQPLLMGLGDVVVYPTSDRPRTRV